MGKAAVLIISFEGVGALCKRAYVSLILQCRVARGNAASTFYTFYARCTF